MIREPVFPGDRGVAAVEIPPADPPADAAVEDVLAVGDRQRLPARADEIERQKADLLPPEIKQEMRVVFILYDRAVPRRLQRQRQNRPLVQLRRIPRQDGGMPRRLCAAGVVVVAEAKLGGDAPSSVIS